MLEDWVVFLVWLTQAVVDERLDEVYVRERGAK